MGHQTFPPGCAPQESLMTFRNFLGQIFPDNHCGLSTVYAIAMGSPVCTLNKTLHYIVKGIVLYQSIVIRVQVAFRVGPSNPAMIHPQDTPISPVYCTILHCCSIHLVLQASNSSSIITYPAPARCPRAVPCGPEQAGDTLLPMVRAGLDTLWPLVPYCGLMHL